MKTVDDFKGYLRTIGFRSIASHNPDCDLFERASGVDRVTFVSVNGFGMVMQMYRVSEGLLERVLAADVRWTKDEHEHIWGLARAGALL